MGTSEYKAPISHNITVISIHISALRRVLAYRQRITRSWASCSGNLHSVPSKHHILRTWGTYTVTPWRNGWLCLNSALSFSSTEPAGRSRNHDCRRQKSKRQHKTRSKKMNCERWKKKNEKAQQMWFPVVPCGCPVGWAGKFTCYPQNQDHGWNLQNHIYQHLGANNSHIYMSTKKFRESTQPQKREIAENKVWQQ